MKLSLLIDNNTFIDRYFQGEPGFSAFLEDGETKVLFDVGYSGLFLENARKMGIDPISADFLILSHSHLDHTWGLEPLIRELTERAFEGRSVSPPELIAHPGAFQGVSFPGIGEIGPLITEEKLAKLFPVRKSAGTYPITEKLLFLGQIPRKYAFEEAGPIGRKDGGGEDTMEDDTALVWQGEEGLVVVTGCSHSGICNIVDYAMEQTGETRIQDIVGGLHLLGAPGERLEKTAAFLKERDIRVMHPCHCTDLTAKIALSGAVRVEEAGVGLVLEYR